jgi:hypothetical protein
VEDNNCKYRTVHKSVACPFFSEFKSINVERQAADKMQKYMVETVIKVGDDERHSLTDIVLCESEKVEE